MSPKEFKGIAGVGGEMAKRVEVRISDKRRLINMRASSDAILVPLSVDLLGIPRMYSSVTYGYGYGL